MRFYMIFSFLMRLCIPVIGLSKPLYSAPQSPTTHKLGPSTHRPQGSGGPKSVEIDGPNSLAVIGYVMELMRQQYVFPLVHRKLMEGALSGILGQDAHSMYLSPQDYGHVYDISRGGFGGIGVELVFEKGMILVVAPLDGSPAAQAGLKPGDLILGVNGVTVVGGSSGLTLMKAAELLKGEPGTKVTLLVKREGSKPKEVVLTREVINLKSVRWHIEKNIGYIRISVFDANTTKLLREAKESIEKKLGSHLKGFILDLRNNPGGLLDQAIGASNLFLEGGENIMSTKGRQKVTNSSVQARPGRRIFRDEPVVIIINEGTASAAEIMTGALQDHKRALVLGVTSYGKGSVQRVQPLGPKGEFGGVQITIALYCRPKGDYIQAVGITPDVEVEQAEMPIPEHKINVREKHLYGALPALEVPLAPEKLSEGTSQIQKDSALRESKASSFTTPLKSLASKDYQLQQACNLVRAMHHYQVILRDRASSQPVSKKEGPR